MNLELTEKIPCPVCGSEKYKVVRQANYPKDLTEEKLLSIYYSSSESKLWDQLVTCEDCQLTYLNPRVRSCIASESYSTVRDEKFSTQNTHRKVTFGQSLEKILKKSGKNPKGLKILDIGSASGAFLQAATEMGCEAIGIEPNLGLCEWGKNNYGVDLRPGKLEDFSFRSQTFDLITLWDVLEHVDNPKSLLRECKRLLKEEGVLVVNFPDYNSIPRKILRKKWPFFLNVHLFYFTPNSLGKLLSHSGFNSFYRAPYWQILSLGYVSERAGNYFSLFKFFNKILNKFGCDSIALKYQMGQSMVLAKHSS